MSPQAPDFAFAQQVGSPRTNPEVYLFGGPGGGDALYDTATHAPRILVRQAFRGRTIFKVFNNENQAITCTLVGDAYNNPAAGQIGGATTIPANSYQIISTDVYGGAWIGIAVNYGVQPSTGKLTVTAVSERDPGPP